MAEMIPLRTICERLGMNPRDARSILRKSDITVETRRWEFPLSLAKRVETLLKKNLEARSAKSGNASKPKDKKKSVEKKPAAQRPRKKIVVVPLGSKISVPTEAIGPPEPELIA